MKLNNRNIQKFKNIKIPTYSRDKITPGIVHIGLGNFHRAHQAWYLHRLFNLGLNFDWGIVGAGVRAYDAKMREKLKNQDYLTTLIELTKTTKTAEICGSMIDYIAITQGNKALIEKMADEKIRIVSLTITEGGYYIDPATKKFDVSHPDIIHDAKNPHKPKTAFGAIIQALKSRKEKNQKPFSCQSCDNLQENGKILKNTILGLAKMSDNKLARWINEHVAFPNSMVDCIVPATGDKEIDLAKEFGVLDDVPVTHEDFRQWVIEDNFCAGRPDWDKVGATFSQNVAKYELMKIRILNGGHQVIAAAADLLNISTIYKAISNDVIKNFLLKVENEEIAPNVQAVAEYTPQEYINLIIKRFSNPNIVDTPKRVAFDGSSRQPGFILPSIKDNLKANLKISGLALVSAIWARYCFGVREDGSIVPPNDPNWSELKILAHKAKKNPNVWLQNKNIYGNLASMPVFADSFINWLKMIYAKGLLNTIEHYLKT